MKQYRKITCAVLLLLVLLPCLFSCVSDQQREVVGRWETVAEDAELGKVSVVYHFTKQNEIFLEQNNGDQIPFSIPFGTYQIKGETIIINSDDLENVYTFSVSDQTLILYQEGEQPMELTRI